MYIYLYIYIYRERERERERYIDREIYVYIYIYITVGYRGVNPPPFIINLPIGYPPIFRILPPPRPPPHLPQLHGISAFL